MSSNSTLSTASVNLTMPREDIGKLVLRLVIGILILLHGIAKLKSGPGFVLGLVSQAGLPSFVAYGVYIGEVIAPVLLLIGLFTRLAGVVIVINMLVAFSLVHMSQLFSLGPQGGWALELQGMYLFGALAVAFLGAGRFSVGGIAGRFN